jgi:proline dehydrogenase
MDLFNRSIVAFLPHIPRALVGLFAKPYVAGGTLDAAIDTVRKLNDAGMMATIDVLGEEVRDPEQAEAFTNQYLDTLRRIDEEGLDANVSVKLSALGQRIDGDLCERNLNRVLTSAKARKSFVRLDMEDLTTTDSTLRIYRAARADFDNLGVVLQARLFRTAGDLQDLLELGVNVRLVKGIYLETPQVALQDDQAIRQAYLDAAERLIDAGHYVALATHDRWIVDRCRELISSRDLRPDQYEFQMLLGVSQGLRSELLEQGHRLRVYVPFGRDWYAYSMRRLRENPKVAGHVLKNLVTLGRL